MKEVRGSTGMGLVNICKTAKVRNASCDLTLFGVLFRTGNDCNQGQRKGGYLTRDVVTSEELCD